MKKAVVFVFLILLFNKSFFCQEKDSLDVYQFLPETTSSSWNEQGITIGVNYSQFLYGEVGYFRSDIYEFGGFPTFASSMNYGIEFSYFDGLIIAPKIQGRVHVYFFHCNLSAIFYSNLKENYALKIRSEIGIGFWNIDVNYGYNIGVVKNNFERANKHVFSLRYYLDFKKSNLIGYDREGNTVE